MRLGQYQSYRKAAILVKQNGINVQGNVLAVRVANKMYDLSLQ